MATSAESHELVSRGKQDLKPAKHTVAKSISPCATEPDATNAQPPEASLLGLPKELLNYIVELAVVKDPDEGPTEVKVNSRHVSRCPTPTPALGRTCKVLEAIVLPIYYGQNTFAFRTSNDACRWLSQRGRRNGMASVRRVKIRFQATGMENGLSPRKDGENLELEIFLRQGSDWLNVAVECSFCARACYWCELALVGKIDNINTRTHYYNSGLERLLALLEDLSNGAGLRLFAEEGWDCGCDWATQQWRRESSNRDVVERHG